MTTYYVTYTIGKYTSVYTQQTAKQVKQFQADAIEDNATVVALKHTPEGNLCHDGNDQVLFIEDRQNGWTLVHNTKTGKEYFAHTANITFR